MPAPESPLASNNPFRRKPSGDPSSSQAITTGGTVPNLSFRDAPPLKPASRPPFTTFKNAVQDNEDVDEDGRRDSEPIQTKPKKIVKKVRVQSPPPSSPEDATPVRSYAANDYSDDSSSGTSEDEEHIDPFHRAPPPETENSILDEEQPLPRAPFNPFSKTLQDLEQSTQEPEGQAAAGGKTSLDVDSFKRLLLTGYANIPGPTPGGQGVPAGAGLRSEAAQASTHDGASNTDASSVSRQSIFDAIQETPRTSHEISESEETEERRSIVPNSPLSNVQSTSGRKKPPPPSSRHGKLIKLELGTATEANSLNTERGTISHDSSSPHAIPGRKTSSQSLSSPQRNSDINKPLPLPPSRTPAEEDSDSPFDTEAAGKLPESFTNLTTSPRPPTPPIGIAHARSTSETSTHTTSSPRKPAAPPPRRQGYGKTDSKPSSILSTATDEDPPRSSLESTRSRADSVRVNVSSDKNLAAPAPPPPRRPHHGRQGSTLTSPSAVSVSSAGASDENRSPGAAGFGGKEQHSSGTMATVTHGKDGSAKLSPPPPPPARHTSIRRHPSNSLDSTAGIASRKTSREKEGGTVAPPPPPPRARGGSRGSTGGGLEAGLARIDSEVDAISKQSSPISDEHPDEAAEDGAGGEIMEQIKALQLEIEAAKRASSTSQ